MSEACCDPSSDASTNSESWTILAINPKNVPINPSVTKKPEPPCNNSSIFGYDQGLLKSRLAVARDISLFAIA
jgi:hypothetical protein